MSLYFAILKSSKAEWKAKKKKNPCKLSAHVLLLGLLSIIDKLDTLEVAQNETNEQATEWMNKRYTSRTSHLIENSLVVYLQQIQKRLHRTCSDNNGFVV